MTWFSTKNKEFPKNGQEVSIIVDGIYYDAYFNEDEKTFTVSDLEFISFKVDDKRIYWSEL